MHAPRPGEVVSSGILDPIGKEGKDATLGQDFLDALIEKQFAFEPSAVAEDGVAPFVVGFVGIEVRRQDEFGDAAGEAHVLDGDFCLFTKEVVETTHGGAIVDVVARHEVVYPEGGAAVWPKPALKDVMSVHSFLTTKNASTLVSLKYATAKIRS